MEEGLFRGVMLNLIRMQLSFGKSIWQQARLFGTWHLVWVLKWYQIGTVSTPGEIGMGIVANFLHRSVWGYAYLKTITCGQPVDCAYTDKYHAKPAACRHIGCHGSGHEHSDDYVQHRLVLMMFLIRYLSSELRK